MKLKIAPSILSANRDNLQQDIDLIENHAEILHVDIMDGKFVPPTTFKPEEIKSVISKLPKDVHLMVEHPLKGGYIDDYIDAGANSITIHIESIDNTNECLDYLEKKGIKKGITINPPTPFEELLPFLDRVDMVLIMSVNPGYAGQKFIPEVLNKIKKIRKLKPNLDIEIDGGINRETIIQAKKAGANIFVAGSAIFGHSDPIEAIKNLKDSLKA